MLYTREEIIQNIKYVGQSIIDNAEKIATDYKYQTDLTIMCNVIDRDKPPCISICTEFIPEQFIERL